MWATLAWISTSHSSSLARWSSPHVWAVCPSSRALAGESAKLGCCCLEVVPVLVYSPFLKVSRHAMAFIVTAMKPSFNRLIRHLSVRPSCGGDGHSRTGKVCCHCQFLHCVCLHCRALSHHLKVRYRYVAIRTRVLTFCYLTTCPFSVRTGRTA